MHGQSPKLPHEGNVRFLTDSGLETTLIFHDKIELPSFAAITLMRTAEGRARLVRYFETHIDIAREAGLGFLIEGPTWRASADWGDKLGIGTAELDGLNRDSIALMRELKERHAGPSLPLLISGNVGPRGDGYRPDALMSAREAQDYHAHQIEMLASAGAEMISAFTMNSDREAIGIARAGIATGVPTVISFTVETDGRLPTGQPLGEAIDAVDQATGGAIAYFMINCAHPDHFGPELMGGKPWSGRVRGLRANASRRSHAELDEATELDEGDPRTLAGDIAGIAMRHGRIDVVGGCCGTDHRHVAEMARALVHW